MFVAVYEFEIKDGTEAVFRDAWLEVTKAIYEYCGSLGSRLHSSEKQNIFVGYAQWPSREHWARAHDVADERFQEARNQMRDCLVHSKVVYELEVSDDYLQSNLAQDG